MRNLILLVIGLQAWCQVVQAQVEKLPPKPEYRLGMNVSQLVVGQVNLELERQMKGSNYSLLGQVFGGQVLATYQSPNSGFNEANHLGMGIAGRYYDKAFGSRLFVQLGGYYKNTSITYMQKQWLNEMQDGVPVIRYGDAEVTDRYSGFGGELLAGAQGFAGKIVIEAAYGIVFRDMRPVGTFHGRDLSGSNELLLNLGQLTPLFIGKVGYCF